MMLKLNNFLYYNITRKDYKNRIAKFLIFLAFTPIYQCLLQYHCEWPTLIDHLTILQIN